MSEESPKTSPTGLWGKFSAMATWKKLLLVGGVLLVAAGCVFQVLAWTAPAPVAPEIGGGAGPLGGGNLVETTGGGAGGSGAQLKSSEEAWSEGFFKLGFSFFAGFAVGSFVRGFLKLFVFFAGAALVLMFALDYFEVAPIDWDKLDGWFDTAKDKVLGETNSFREFLSTRLPSGGMAGLGLFTGFKKG